MFAHKMTPQSFDEIVGQDHLVGPNGIVRSMLDNDRFLSFVLYGVPGIGKTTISRVIAEELQCPFVAVNASTDDKKCLVSAVEECIDSENPGVVFIDELHRLDKTKQDYLLSVLESGKVRIIGATTDNPYLNLRPALRSRMHIFELHALSENDIARKLTECAVREKLIVEPKVIDIIVRRASGDMRYAYNLLELADMLAASEQSVITVGILERVCNVRNLEGDADGNTHYDLISALQKSIRGSDADAALYYLACLLEIGDLPILIRRLTVILYEDIGLANPEIFAPVTQAIQSAKELGLPEAKIPLSVAVSLMSLSAKSNEAYTAINAALEDVRQVKLNVPKHLRDAHYKGSDLLGSGIGYQYPHDYPNHIVKQTYLPEELYGREYLNMSRFGDENGSQKFTSRLCSLRNYLRSE